MSSFLVLTVAAAIPIGQGSPMRDAGLDWVDVPPIEDSDAVVGAEPTETEGLDIVEKRGQTIPKNVAFTRPDGQVITMGQLLDGPPMLLLLNYSRCPMLCGQQQRSLAEGLAELKLEPGRDYRLVSVSIDPLESPETAGETRRNFLKVMQRKPSTPGVDFLVGTRREIDTLADAVGFEYEYIPKQNTYAHNAVMVVLSPDGMISRYLYGYYGPNFDQRTLRLSVVEASEGKVSSIFDRVILQCFKYDAMTGKYTPLAWGIMRTGAVVTILALGVLLLPVWWRAAKRARHPRMTDDDGASANAGV